ncbi:DUF5060 domain-containing protein [Streptomyces sp. SID8361]|nr:DUF5060 domain-containing protein [Streptomyces sp. SID8361]
MDNPQTRALLDKAVPGLVDSPSTTGMRGFPIGVVLRFILTPDTEKADTVLAQIGTVEDSTHRAPEPAPVLPRPDYERNVERGSATLAAPRVALMNTTTEIVINGPSHGNPFVDVELSAEFSTGELTVTVGGFYDGDGRYLLRFLPSQSGEWRFTTSSNALSLDSLSATIVVAPSDTPGAVRVADTYDFAYADGTPYVPIGTTAYAWTHQPAELQDQTIGSLAQAPFNKLRMGLFPKDFLYNSNEPDDHVFPRADDGSWDTQRFNVAYFANLEARLRQLDEIGIQADLILFHPYDRWGFANLGNAADDRYVRYVVRRLAAFPNVWWSMANEYDLILNKRPADWDRLAGIVRSEDHAQHPTSIHNWFDLYDYSAPWATHASIQSGDTQIGKAIAQWRTTWRKPVVVDEFGYDGDLDQEWGNLTSEDVVDRFWNGMLHGGYLTHGETLYRDDEVIWWSKGGILAGESAARIAFLRRIVEESPTGRLAPLGPRHSPVAHGGVHGEYVLLYFGRHRPRFYDVAIPDGMRATIQVIDAWNMTIEDIGGTHEGTIRVNLPARPFIAVRLKRA